jgi:hypothetical protein
MPAVDARTTIERGAVAVESPVTVNTPPVNVAPAEVRVENTPPQVNVDVHVPEQKHPKRTTKFLKDKNGEITGKVEEDA